jgi:hypothetical protein
MPVAAALARAAAPVLLAVGRAVPEAGRAAERGKAADEVKSSAAF